MSKDLFEKLSHPIVSVPSSGTGLTVGLGTGNAILLGLSILLVLVQLYVHSPKIIKTTRFYIDAFNEWRAGL